MSDLKETIREKLILSRQNLLAVVENLNEEQWAKAVFADSSEWSVSDLLRHLTDAERGMTALVSQIKQGGEGVPADFDLQRWNKNRVTRLRDKSPAGLLNDMTTNRSQLLTVLDTLEPADWAKQGRHGSLQIMSIEQIFNLIADHEISHSNDIRKATTA